MDLIELPEFFLPFLAELVDRLRERSDLSELPRPIEQELRPRIVWETEYLKYLLAGDGWLHKLFVPSKELLDKHFHVSVIATFVFFNVMPTFIDMVNVETTIDSEVVWRLDLDSEAETLKICGSFSGFVSVLLVIITDIGTVLTIHYVADKLPSGYKHLDSSARVWNR